MGFSTSASLLLIGLGLFIALGTLYGAVSNTMERVKSAQAAQFEHINRIQGTRINITSINLSDATCGVNITVNNTGETKLTVNHTDLLFDNSYETGWQNGATVDGDSSTWLWLPGETLKITRNGLSNAPNRVRLVSGPGVADTEEVGLTC